MRDIKFRGKKESDGSWIFGSLTHLDDSVCMIYSGRCHGLVERESIGQYTGLRDDVAKEIYEGDILEIYNVGAVGKPEHYIGAVEWEKGSFVCSRADEPKSIPLRDIINAVFSIEVIGNIHENENILKGVRCCDCCGNNMYDGYYHEDSGDVVCDRECGNKHFEDFEERNEALEIIWTSFEY